LAGGTGVLYIETHGGYGNIASVFASSRAVLAGWMGLTEDMYIGEDLYDHYCVYVRKPWFIDEWQPELSDANGRAIVVLAACHSFDGAAGETSVLEAVGGRIGFGYLGEVFADNFKTDMITLFGRMNGTADQNLKRTAEKAYGEEKEYPHGFRMRGEGLTTLCPATAPNESGSLDVTPKGYTQIVVGQGRINFDTYCDCDPIKFPADEALTHVVAEGGVCEVNNFRWVKDDLGRSRSIYFNYNGSVECVEPKFKVTMTAHADKIEALDGGGQKLDGDRVAPNGNRDDPAADNVIWTFEYHKPPE